MKAKTADTEIQTASAKPGHTWAIRCYKDHRGRIVATAQEGRKKRRVYSDGLAGTSFEYAMGFGFGGGDRRMTLDLDYPDGAMLTAKRQQAGLQRMKAYLITAGAALDAPAPLFSDTDERAQVEA